MKFPHAQFYRFACVFTAIFFLGFLSFVFTVGAKHKSNSTALRTPEILQKRVQAERQQLTLSQERELRQREQNHEQ